MTVKSFQSLVNENAKPPSALAGTFVDNPVGTFDWGSDGMHGMTQSSTVTSATLTEVLGVTGSGVVTAMHLIHPATEGIVATPGPKVKIILDGVTITDEEVASMNTDRDSYAYVGSLIGIGAAAIDLGISRDDGRMVFNKSISILIAGDGSDGVALLYDHYLT